jgi:Lon protease-like protein
MKLPAAIAVMPLPDLVLFPKATLPLHIFEPRYRQMLVDVLRTHRLLVVAMRQPGESRERPAQIAGVGMIRASVRNRDGTSNLMLQGIARVELGRAIQCKPYRIHRIHELCDAQPEPSAELNALADRVRELIIERFQKAVAATPLPALQQAAGGPGGFPGYLRKLKEPGTIADIAACSLLRDPLQRQALLETLDVKLRLRRLIHFLLEQSTVKRKNGRHE